MLLRIDEASPEPLRGQIAAGIRRALAQGEIAAGERLPSAAALGKSLGVNVHTVLGAFQDLRDEGLIELRRGRGATVRSDAGGQAAVIELAKGLLAEAKRLGMSGDELAAMIRRLQ